MKIRVRLLLFPEGVGGRKNSIADGYRPDWKLEGGFACASIKFGDFAVRLEPGYSETVTLYPLVDESWKNLKEKDQILCYEGPRMIGVARVLEIIQEFY